MKLMSEVAKSHFEVSVSREDKLVHLIASSQGYLPVEPPKWAKDIQCPFCGESTFYLSMFDKEKRTWICGRNCSASRLPFNAEATSTMANVPRALEWPLFCELNGIGDLHHNVKFENIRQSHEKLDYMLKFVTSPQGILFMRGDPGTGKTYAAMAICEFFTRKSKLGVFTTQKQMSNNWLINQNEKTSNYVNNLMVTPLLVVDDFATGEPNPKFLEFFMELINTRMQWKSRGTVITTNLDIKKFSAFCGAALAGRIMTGQVFNFEGETRRKKVVL